MAVKVGSGIPVLGVPEVMHSTKSSLALVSSTWEEVAELALMVLNRDILLEN